MTEQPPSAEALELAGRIRSILGGEHFMTEREAAEDIDALCEQRVSAERERCAQVAERFTEPRILVMWERPGGPPGNGWVPLTGKHVADAIRAPAERPAPPQQQDSLRGLGVEQPTQETARLGCGDRWHSALRAAANWHTARAAEFDNRANEHRDEQEKLVAQYGDNAKGIRAEQIDYFRERARAERYAAEQILALPIPSALASTGEQPDCGEIRAVLEDLIHQYIELAIQTKQPSTYRLNPSLVRAAELVELLSKPTDAGGLSSTSKADASQDPLVELGRDAGIIADAAPGGDLSSTSNKRPVASDYLCDCGVESMDFCHAGMDCRAEKISPPPAVVDYTERAQYVVRRADLDKWSTAGKRDAGLAELIRRELSAVASEHQAEIAAWIRRAATAVATTHRVQEEHQTEIAALRHDIERYQAIASSEAAGHSEALAKLARLWEPEMVKALAAFLAQGDADAHMHEYEKRADAALVVITEMLT